MLEVEKMQFILPFEYDNTNLIIIIIIINGNPMTENICLIVSIIRFALSFSGSSLDNLNLGVQAALDFRSLGTQRFNYPLVIKWSESIDNVEKMHKIKPKKANFSFKYIQVEILKNFTPSKSK